MKFTGFLCNTLENGQLLYYSGEFFFARAKRKMAKMPALSSFAFQAHPPVRSFSRKCLSISSVSICGIGTGFFRLVIRNSRQRSKLRNYEIRKLMDQREALDVRINDRAMLQRRDKKKFPTLVIW